MYCKEYKDDISGMFLMKTVKNTEWDIKGMLQVY